MNSKGFFRNSLNYKSKCLKSTITLMKFLLLHHCGKVVVSILLLATSLSSVAGGLLVPTRNEIRLLPPYCQAKLDPKRHSKLVTEWKDMPFYSKLDDYCQALNFLNRAYKSTGEEKRSNSSIAREAFDYSIRNWPENHPLMPEVYLNRGIAMRMLGDDVEGLKNYYKALSLNPRLRGAYLELADYFAANNDREEGLKIITEGLTNLPEDQELRQRYAQMGGSLPFPKPIEQAGQQEEKSSLAKAGEIATEVSAMEAKEAVPQAPNEAKKDSSPALDNPPPAFRKPEIDPPSKNPWCRFCPEANARGR